MYLVLIVGIAISCTKNEIEYQSDTIGDVAEFQLHYYVPINAVSTNYIYKVEVNSQLYANSLAPLSTYSAIPGGDVGRFYTVAPGSVNFKLYMGTAQTLVYDKNVTLATGKQNVFVYDFAKDPIVFDNGYPYSANLTMDTDSACYVKFYNFLYEKAGIPSTLKLQYQYTDPRTKGLVNIGKPVAFGETTGWQPVKVVKSIFISYGYNKVDFSIKIVDAAGNLTGDLQVWNSTKFIPYTGPFTEYIGRRYHHVLAGMRAESPSASVRAFTAL